MKKYLLQFFTLIVIVSSGYGQTAKEYFTRGESKSIELNAKGSTGPTILKSIAIFINSFSLKIYSIFILWRGSNILPPPSKL